MLTADAVKRWGSPIVCANARMDSAESAIAVAPRIRTGRAIRQPPARSIQRPRPRSSPIRVADLGQSAEETLRGFRRMVVVGRPGDRWLSDAPHAATVKALIPRHGA